MSGLQQQQAKQGPAQPVKREFEQQSLSPPLKKAQVEQSATSSGGCEGGAAQFNSNSGDTSGSGTNQVNHVSVNIVQQINQSSEIKINVQSTVHTSQNSSKSSSTSTKIQTNICKEEPNLSSTSQHHQQPSSSLFSPDFNSDSTRMGGASNTAAFDDGDELERILADLDDLEDNKTLLHQQFSAPANQNSPLNQHQHMQRSNSAHTEFSKSFPSAASPLDGLQATKQPNRPDAMFTQNPTSLPVYGSPSSNPGTPGTPGMAHLPSYPSEAAGGPAAETLKQMAAQHQSNEFTGPYGAYRYDSYSENMTQRSPGFGAAGYNVPPYLNQQAGSNAYAYGPQVPRAPYMQGQGVPGQMPGGQRMPMHAGASDMNNAPHFSNNNSMTSSSLQQLQQHVKTQFSGDTSDANGDAQHVMMSQSQHVRLANPAGVHMSQTQSMQFGRNNSMNATQEQSINMHYSAMHHQQHPQHLPPGHPGHMTAGMSEQARMKLFHREKMFQQHQQQMQQQQLMREEEMRRVQQRTQQQQQQQQQQFAKQRQQPAIQPPPPDYKSQNSTNTPSPNPARHTPSSVSRNSPLVRSDSKDSKHPVTSSSLHPAAATTSITKTSASGAHAPALQSSTMPVTTSLPTSDVKTVNPNSSTYTSAIMRGQRPPNVNVGPDGLNISQSRHMPNWASRMPVASNMNFHPQNPHMRVPHPGMYPGGGGGFGPSGGMGMHPHPHPSHLHMSQQQAMHHAYQRSMSAGAGVPPGAHAYPGQVMSMSQHHHQQFMMSQSQQQQAPMLPQHAHPHHMMPHPGMTSRTNSCPHPPNAAPQQRPIMGGGFYPQTSASPFHNDFPLGSPQNVQTSNAAMFDR